MFKGVFGDLRHIYFVIWPLEIRPKAGMKVEKENELPLMQLISFNKLLQRYEVMAESEEIGGKIGIPIHFIQQPCKTPG